MLRGLTWTHVLAYLDDVIVLGKSFLGGIENLIVTLQRFRIHNLKLKPRKCNLFQTEVEFHGRCVSRYGITITKDKAEEILRWPVPKSKEELQSFLGFMNYHHGFVQGYAGITTCLYALTAQGVPYDWTD